MDMELVQMQSSPPKWCDGSLLSFPDAFTDSLSKIRVPNCRARLAERDVQEDEHSSVST